MSRLVIGITGGIGSGKTAVSDRFKALGVTVVDADIASRVIVEPGRPALVAIAEHFGCDVIQADGSLDRAELRRRVFADPDERRWLEQLTHPLINEHIREELEQAECWPRPASRDSVIAFWWWTCRRKYRCGEPWPGTPTTRPR